MENPIDHTIDLGFVNYVTHPTNKKYIVFRFVDPDRSASFRRFLEEDKIWFEKSEDVKRGRDCDLYAIHQSDYNKVEKINYKVEALHKKPVLANAFLRYGLLLLFFTALFFAILGYNNQSKQLVPSVNPAAQSNPIQPIKKVP